MVRVQRYIILAALALPLGVFAQGPNIDHNPAAWGFQDGSVAIICVGPDGQPLPGAELRIAEGDWGPRHAAPNDAPELMYAQTDEAGRYTLTGVDAGVSRLVYATHDGLGLWARLPAPRPSNKHPESWLTLNVRNTARGIVTDEWGVPLEGVEIAFWGAIPAATTDSEGRFAVPHIDDQTAFGFHKDRYAWMGTDLMPNIRKLQLILPRAGRIRVQVVDPGGHAVQGARVSYNGGHAYYGGPPEVFGQTDATGTFETSNLPAFEQLFVSASIDRDGFRWTASGSIELEPNETAPLILHLEKRSRIVMQPPEEFPDAPPVAHYEPLEGGPQGVVSGKVVDVQTGRPVSACIMYDNEKSDVDDYKGHTREGGTFRLNGLEPYLHYFAAAPDDPTRYTAGGVQAANPKAGEPVKDMIFKIAQGCAIRGKVISADGLPVPDASVYVDPQNPNHYRVWGTDDEGRFFLRHLAHPDKPYTVHAGIRGGFKATVTVPPVGAGNIADGIVIRMDDVYLAEAETHAFSGRVIDKADNPVRVANVFLPPEFAADPAMTDDNGHFTLHVRRGGEATIRVEPAPHVLVNNESSLDIRQECDVLAGGVVDLAPDGPTTGHIVRVSVPDPPLWLGGWVTDPEYRPIKNGTIEWRIGGKGGAFTSVQNGRFLMSNIDWRKKGESVTLRFKSDDYYHNKPLKSGEDFYIGQTDIHIIAVRHGNADLRHDVVPPR